VVGLLFCFAMMKLHGSNRIVLAVLALCTFPPTLLSSLAIFSSPHMDVGGHTVEFFIGLGIVLSGVKRMALSLLKVFSLPSRWKYLTFQAHASLFTSMCEAISPFLLMGLSAWWRMPFDTAGDYAMSDVFARSSVFLSLPFSVTYFLVNLASFAPLVKEGVLPWHRKLKVRKVEGRVRASVKASVFVQKLRKKQAASRELDVTEVVVESASASAGGDLAFSKQQGDSGGSMLGLTVAGLTSSMPHAPAPPMGTPPASPRSPSSGV